jgi:transposase InsO family protein
MGAPDPTSASERCAGDSERPYGRCWRPTGRSDGHRLAWRGCLAPVRDRLVARPREELVVLRVLHEPDHVDEAPATVYAKLLDAGVYLALVPTMYRILRAEGEVSERRRQATHPLTVKPELLASGPNQVWSWDIERHDAPGNREEVQDLLHPAVAAAG